MATVNYKRGQIYIYQGFHSVPYGTELVIFSITLKYVTFIYWDTCFKSIKIRSYVFEKDLKQSIYTLFSNNLILD